METLRQCVVDLLRGGGAHATLAQGLDGLSAEMAGKKPPKAAHSGWELVEHIRIAQRDILEFTLGPQHVSPAWPEGYWPDSSAPPSAAAWKASCNAVEADLAAFVALVADTHNDLLAPLPHDGKKSILREALTLADHNAYHLGQLIELRKMLGAWG